jgi:glycosidase
MLTDNIFGDQIESDKRLLNRHSALLGVKHHHKVSPPVPAPGQPFTLHLTTSGPQAFDAARCWYRLESNGVARPMMAVDMAPDGVVWDSLEWGYVRHWNATLPPQPAGTMVRYRLAARLSGSEDWVFAENQGTSTEAATPFALWVDEVSPPAWANESITYHIFLDRFYPGDGVSWRQTANIHAPFGGTLRGVIQKLDYIQSLGFNTLWLSPLFASPAYHGYHATALYTVEPRMGTNADLLELIASAHGRGMRVILDFVANHWSDQHPTFKAALEEEASPYHDWYIWKHWPDDYETYFGVKELPQLNLQYGPARDYMLECARYWLAQGVDGYRLDYALGPSHEFWADFRRACRVARPDCWLFGEVISTADVALSYGGRLHGTLDFLLARALRETFAFGWWTVAEFESFLAAHESFFPPEFSRLSFLDNHDMNRFLYIADGEVAKVKLGALALFTLSGPPIVYYGTEAAVTQERPIHQNDFGIFEEARLPMKWGADQNQELLDYFRRLIALRKALPVLRNGSRRVLHLDAEAGTYAYLRERGGERAIAAFNLGGDPLTLRLRLPGEHSGSPLLVADRLNGHPVRIGADFVEIDLPGKSGALIG